MGSECADSACFESSRRSLLECVTYACGVNCYGITIQKRNDRQIADIGQAQRSHVVAMYICNVDICWRVTQVKWRQTRITALRRADTIVMIDVFVSI